MSEIACELCGTSFDPSSHRTCESCPMAGACTLTCCPQCGYTGIDVSRSRLARRLDAMLSAPRRLRRSAPDSVLSIAPGASVRVASFGPWLTPDQVTLLRTYGIDAGRTVRVVQHRPMTVLGVDHTEIALESELAAGVLVRSTTRETLAGPP